MTLINSMSCLVQPTENIQQKKFENVIAATTCWWRILRRCSTLLGTVVTINRKKIQPEWGLGQGYKKQWNFPPKGEASANSNFQLKNNNKDMGFKHWIWPNDNNKHYDFFSIFGWGPSSAWILVQRVAQPFTALQIGHLTSGVRGQNLFHVMQMIAKLS